MEIYSLGIGLTVVDSASKPIRSVDSALASMAKTTRFAGNAAELASAQLGGTGFAASLLPPAFRSVEKTAWSATEQLSRMAGAARAAAEAGVSLERIMSGNSVDDSLISVADAAEDATGQTAGLEQQLQSTADAGRAMTDIADMQTEALGAQGNAAAYARARYEEAHQEMRRSGTAAESALGMAETAFRQLGQSIGLVGRSAEDLPDHMTRMRDAAGRFTKIRLDGSLDGIAASLANVIGKTRTMFAEMRNQRGLVMLGKRLSDMGGTIAGTVASFESLSWLGSTVQETFLNFEDSTQKLAMGFGGTSEDAYQLRSAMLDVGFSTQFSLGEISKLTNELGQAGVNLTDMAKDEREAFIALNDVFGVSGTDIAAMDSTLRAFGGSLTDTLDEAAAFQSSFGIPGLFAELPGIVSGAGSSMLRFGDAVAASLPQIVSNVTRMAGVIAKAYGKTMREAVQSAQKDFETFASASRQHEDVFLGLSDSFSPLQEALMEVGRPLMDTARLMRLGQTDSLAYAEEMRGVYLSLDEGSFQARRFRSQMAKTGMSEEMTGLVFAHGRLADAQEAKRAADAKEQADIRSGVASFKDLSDGMLETTNEMRKMWGNVKELGKAFLAQTGLTDALKGAFKGAKDTFAAFGKEIQAFIESDEMRAWGEKLVPVLKTAGKWFLLIGTAAGSALGAIGSVAVALGAMSAYGKGAKMLTDFFGGMGKAGGVTGKLAKALGAVGSKFGSITKLMGRGLPVIGTAVAAFSGVSAAVMDMGDVLGDPSASGVEKFVALTRGVIKGFAAAFNSVLLGIPGWLADTFFPDLGRKFDDGFADLFSGIADMDVGEALVEMWNTATNWLGERFSKIDNWIAGQLPDWKDMAADWGKNIGGAMGGLAKMLVDGLVWGVKNLNIVSVLGDLWNWAVGASADGLEDSGAVLLAKSLFGIFNSAGQVIIEVGASIAEGFFGAFGTSMDELGYGFALLSSDMMEVFHISMLKMGNFGLELFLDPMLVVFAHLRSAFSKVAVYAKGSFQMAFALIEDAASGNFDGISRLISDATTSATLTMSLIFQKAFATIGGYVDSFVATAIGALFSLVKGIAPLATLAGYGEEIEAATKAIDEQKDAVEATAKARVLAVTKTEQALKRHTEEQKEQKEQKEDEGSAVDRVRKQMAVELSAIDKTRTSRLAAIAEASAARVNEIGQVKESYAAEQTKTEQQLHASTQVRLKREGDEEGARKFTKDQANSIDSVLSQMAAKTEKMSAGNQRTAAKAVRDHMSTTLRETARGMAKGSLTMEQAQQKMTDAGTDAITKGMDAVEAAREKAKSREKAGAVAEAAKPSAAGGFSPAQLQAVMAQFQREVGAARREQQSVSVTLVGRPGDGLTKQLVAKAEASSKDG